MSRYYVPCTTDFLAETIWKYMEKQIKDEGYEDDRLEEIKNESFVDKTKSFPGFDFSSITDKVSNDLRKVAFDTENIEGKGFKQITEDLVCFLVEAFGDWEVPMYFIIYWDGKELRGYVPTEGNPWNTDEKAAYGNNEESDEQNAMKRFGVYHGNIHLQSFEPLWQDIRERITLSPTWSGVVCGSKTVFEPTSAIGKILQARPAEAHSLVNQYPVANDEELAQQIVNDLKLALEERDKARRQLAGLKRVCEKIAYVMTDAEEILQDSE